MAIRCRLLSKGSPSSNINSVVGVIQSGIFFTGLGAILTMVLVPAVADSRKVERNDCSSLAPPFPNSGKQLHKQSPPLRTGIDSQPATAGFVCVARDFSRWGWGWWVKPFLEITSAQIPHPFLHRLNNDISKLIHYRRCLLHCRFFRGLFSHNLRHRLHHRIRRRLHRIRR
jgi:hypothetical protein